QPHVGDAALAGMGIDRAFRCLVVDNQRPGARDRIDPGPAPAAGAAAPDGRLLALKSPAMKVMKTLPGRLDHVGKDRILLGEQGNAALGSGGIAGITGGCSAI